VAWILRSNLKINPDTLSLVLIHVSFHGQMSLLS
jgi:hypothetical protein